MKDSHRQSSQLRECKRYTIRKLSFLIWERVNLQLKKMLNWLQLNYNAIQMDKTDQAIERSKQTEQMGCIVNELDSIQF
ncbi:hypothetical protein Ahy_A01g000542 isoform A [Arachis hypogaea]|uniref:Uncharacterized protein n=1 Tax=Arachis hypogaea TaxID=3818 RepID=A0A445EKQ1_ARAHY|nr:hypothetical protein Ahy_A01g000542 isoform A [Arachis hypogaea]